MEQANNAMLPLDEPRVIALKEGKFTYIFRFRRIVQTAWERHFSGIYYTSKNQGNARVDVMDLNTAGIELLEENLESVEGYAGDFMSRPEWKKKIPPRHAHAVSWALRLVKESQQENDAPLDPERIEVALDAVWSQEIKGAEMNWYVGLKHYFAPATAKDKQDYFRAGGASKVIGGGRNGVTIHPQRHAVLLRLYDALILEVDGYSVRSEPLKGAEAIRREMDAYHKLQAIQQIFMGGAGAGEEAE